MMMLAMMMMLMAPMLIANSLSGKQIYQWIEIRNEHIMIGANMIEITEQEVMDALDELMKAGKVRSFVKEGGDPLNPDDWLYEAVKSVD
jgi:molybdopterin biosynthesis enzyme MoaB